MRLLLNSALCLAVGYSQDIHYDDADDQHDGENHGDLAQDGILGMALILAVIAVCIAAAGHSAQTLRVSLLEAYTQKDGNRQNQHCRTEDIGCYH